MVNRRTGYGLVGGFSAGTTAGGLFRDDLNIKVSTSYWNIGAPCLHWWAATHLMVLAMAFSNVVCTMVFLIHIGESAQCTGFARVGGFSNASAVDGILLHALLYDVNSLGWGLGAPGMH